MGRDLQLSGFNIDTKSFGNIPEFADALAEYYVSVIDLWSEALNSLKRKPFEHFKYSVKGNANSQFGDFIAVMSKNQDQVSKCAAAVDRAKSSQGWARSEREWEKADADREGVYATERLARPLLNSHLERSRRSKQSQTGELNRWLAPGQHAVDEYERHYMERINSIHTGTCQWILQLPAFITWKKRWKTMYERLLWISAAPGAGKTSLSSFLISHLQSPPSDDSCEVFYYMFNGKNAETSTDLSAACALIHQLLNRSEHVDENLVEELYGHRVDKGQQKASDFKFLWNLFIRYVRRITGVVVVIDGLDECTQWVSFTESIFDFWRDSSAKFIILSRRQAEVPIELPTRLILHLNVRFGWEENQNDIRSFLQFAISKSPKLSRKSVQKQVHQRFGTSLAELLLSRANGLFIWASSALKVLGSKMTSSEVVAAAERLPTDLVELYRLILEEYNQRYTEGGRQISCMVLRWLVCASRPLSVEELFLGVKSEYLRSSPVCEESEDREGDQEDEVLFDESEFRNCFGPLVNVNDTGTVELAHISIAEFLCQETPTPETQHGIHHFFVELPSANFSLAKACL